MSELVIVIDLFKDIFINFFLEVQFLLFFSVVKILYVLKFI